MSPVLIGKLRTRALSAEAMSPAPAIVEGPSTITLGRIQSVEDRLLFLDFQFNPENITVAVGQGTAKKSPFAPPSGVRRASGGPQGSGTGSVTRGTSAPSPNTTVPTTTVTFSKLYFDGGFSYDVSGDINVLVSMMMPPSSLSSPTKPAPRATTVQVTIGSKTWVKGKITSISVNYTKFSPLGWPTRALVSSLAVTASADWDPRQNPTSGGIASYSGYAMSQGDSLQSVAYNTYGHARLWRPLAVINGIDDPLRVAAGTMLMLPTLSELLAAE